MLDPHPRHNSHLQTCLQVGQQKIFREEIWGPAVVWHMAHP